MINSDELRIGNWVEFYGHAYPIASINSDNTIRLIDSFGKEHGCYSVGKIKSIPITEEWLLRLGFKRKDEWSRILLPINALLQLQGNAHGQVDLVDNKSIEQLNVRCESVHQLQNLYYALTGTKLECAP